MLVCIGFLNLSCQAQFMGDIMGRIDEIYSSNIYFCPSISDLDTYICESYPIGEEITASDLPVSENDSRFDSFNPGYDVVGWAFYSYGSLVDDKLKLSTASINTEDIVSSESGSSVASIKITSNHIILTAIYSVADDTPYSVVPFLESLDQDGGYVEDEDYTEEYQKSFEGTTGTELSLEVINSVIYLNEEEIQMEIPGFEIVANQDKIEDTIKADGSTVLQVNFNRKTVTLTIDSNGGSPSTQASLTGKFGAALEVDESDYTKENCALAGWTVISNGETSTVESLPETFPSCDTTYKAIWKSSGLGGLDIELPDDYSELDLNLSGSASTSSDTITISMTLPSGYVLVGWFVNGSGPNDTTSTSLQLSKADYIGSNQVVVVVRKTDYSIYYANTINFVVNGQEVTFENE